MCDGSVDLAFDGAAGGDHPGMDHVVTTPDGHHIVVDGRRWRATDPHIPERLRAELVAELMDARRSVAAGTRAKDDQAVTTARRRVQDAKVALGERGAPWWEPASPNDATARLAATMRALLRHRATGSTICPSDVARVAGGTSWRQVMDQSRAVAFELQRDGVVEVRQRGARVDDPEQVRGPLRIARGRAFD
jgi:hypothetical protein